MGDVPAALPAGYARFVEPDGVELVALAGPAPAVREALGEGTLYDYAARHPRRREFNGRGVAYAVPLPDARTQVVVRHSRHGGLLAPVTGDRFLPPTRAPHELRTAVRLAACGVRTPEVVAYAVYPAGPLLRRSDVATREVPRARDLAVTLLADDAGAKRAALGATATLLAALARCGARHHDLNLKNVLLAPTEGTLGRVEAWILDVDRVEFHAPGDPAVERANLERLARSARKWRDLYGAHVDEDDLAWLADVSARGAA